MIKKIIFIAICSLLVLCFTRCDLSYNGQERNNADIDSKVDREIGALEIYSYGDISSAMDYLTSFFNEYSEGCILKKLIYDENYSQSVGEKYRSSDEDEVVIITMVYCMDEYVSNGDLIPANENIVNDWVLVRINDKWNFLGEPNIYRPGIKEYPIPNNL